MAQTIRLTITPDLEKAIAILRRSITGTLNTTEIIKMAVGAYAQVRAPATAVKDQTDDISPQEWDKMSARQFYEWAKEDGSLYVDNISPNAKLKPFIPETYVPDR